MKTEIARDLIAGSAMIAIGGGCWLIHPPTALIVMGAIMLILILASGGRGGTDDTG